MAKSPPIAVETLAAVIAAIEAAQRAGCPVASWNPSIVEETARVAIRRWRSSARRGVDQSDHQARIRDLTKAFVAHFERDPKLVGPLLRDYEYLAAETAKAL
jgi:hypothetical protein